MTFGVQVSVSATATGLSRYVQWVSNSSKNENLISCFEAFRKHPFSHCLLRKSSEKSKTETQNI